MLSSWEVVFQCIEVLLEKFREKKPAVVLVIKEGVDASYASVRNFSILCYFFYGNNHSAKTSLVNY